jgi:invasion protein IalB
MRVRAGFVAAAIAQMAAFATVAIAQERGPAGAPGESKQKTTATSKAGLAAPDRTTETFGDWSIMCSTPGAAQRACEVDTAVILRGQSAPFSRIAITRAGRDKPVRIIALVPVNVSIAPGVKIESDAGKSVIDLPFRSCVPSACVAEAELSKEAVQAFRAPAKAAGQLTVVDASGKSATLQLSLRGLNEALEVYFKQQDK